MVDTIVVYVKALDRCEEYLRRSNLVSIPVFVQIDVFLCYGT